MKFWTAKFKDACKCDENRAACFHTQMGEIKALTFLVCEFGARLIDRVLRKFQDGVFGWDNEEIISTEVLVASLKDSLAKKKWIDVAAYAMFLQNREDE